MDKEENKQLIDGATDLLKRVNLRTSADANSLINEIMNLADSYSRILDEASILGVMTSIDKYKVSYFNIIAMDENDGLQMQYGGGFLSSVCINGLELENNSDDVFQELQYGGSTLWYKIVT